MSKIKSIIAREIKDSRGNPTVEVVLETEKGEYVASVPSGASTGKNEALELRDADGKGVLQAIKNVNEIIAPKFKGKDVINQTEIDELMIKLDGTENKSRLGANAILAVSIAVCRAGAGAQKIPLYQHIRELSVIPGLTRNPESVHEPLDSRFRGNDTAGKFRIPLAMFNVLEGGAHVRRDGDKPDIQEFMVVPQKKTFAENLVLCNKIFQNLSELIKKNFGSVEMGDEGGFAPKISKTEQALYLLKNAIGNEDAKIALDCAASQFYKDGKYIIEGQEFTDAGLLEFYENLINNFSLPTGRQAIISIEDPYAENDWNGFELAMRHFSHSPVNERDITVVGDDLTTTNIKRIKEAHNKNACNGIILKLNQIGTVTETINAAKLARSFGWKTIVSHRSGETMDDFIADLAVGLSTDFIKSGSPTKEERMVKYNRLLVIEQELNKK